MILDSLGKRAFWITILRHMTHILKLLLPAGILFGTVAVASGPRSRYLQESYAELGYPLAKPPTAPADAEILAIDLDQVRAAQVVDHAAKEEAFADADAFGFDALLPRFSAAAGETLTIQRRPILAHMLRWVLADTGAYGDAIKAPYPRTRPYKTDPTIQLCDLSFMKDSGDQSYPSGHSTNGYIAGLLLSKVVQTRAPTIMARGVRYGTNRTICGAHYPSDVVAGQLFARFLFARISVDPLFQNDLDCAIEEEDADERGKLPNRTATPVMTSYSPTCAQLDQRYAHEMADYLKSH